MTRGRGIASYETPSNILLYLDLNSKKKSYKSAGNMKIYSYLTSHSVSP